MKTNSSLVEGFLDGQGAGLFTRLRRPGAPDELIDSRPLDEYCQSDDFRETLARFGKKIPAEAAGNPKAAYDERSDESFKHQLETVILLLVRLDVQVDKAVKAIDHIEGIKDDPSVTALRSSLLEVKHELTSFRQHY